MTVNHYDIDHATQEDEDGGGHNTPAEVHDEGEHSENGGNSHHQNGN